MRTFSHSALLVLFLFSVLALTVGTAGASEFNHTEYSVFGSSNSSSWQTLLNGQASAFDQIGGDKADATDEFSGGIQKENEEDDQDGTTNMGRKVKTGLLSALMPGAGQYYNGYKKKAYVMAGVEVGIWTVYFIFDKQGDNRMASAREYAALYAGTSGGHDESYWQSLGRYMDSDAYNEAQLREARALQEPVGDLMTGSDAWQWANADRKTAYQIQRADGNTAYDHRDFMILFSVINRAFSVIDGVMGVKSHPGGIEADVLGLNVSVDMLPSWNDPGAKWAITRRF